MSHSWSYPVIGNTPNAVSRTRTDRLPTNRYVGPGASLDHTGNAFSVAHQGAHIPNDKSSVASRLDRPLQGDLMRDLARGPAGELVQCDTGINRDTLWIHRRTTPPSQ